MRHGILRIDAVDCYLIVGASTPLRKRGTDVVYDPFQQGVIDGLRGDDLHSPPARRRA